MATRVVYVPGSSTKVCQLTGEFDRERGQPTHNRTETRFGLFGTDLGASFEHNGRAYFLFGDTISTDATSLFALTAATGAATVWRPRDGDSIAWTDDMTPGTCLNLQFVTAPDGRYLAPSVPGVSLGSFEVPTGGFSAQGHMYVFFTTDHTEQVLMGRSVLARSDDGGQSFRLVYDVSRLSAGGRFINVSPAVVNNADIPGLPDRTGQGVLLWGSAAYRASNPYLAYLPLSAVEQRTRLRYFAGLAAGTGRPQWSRSEAAAVPLFQHPCIGELSVTWNPFLARWLMLYNCDNPRGIVFRVAEQPWGPWSPAAVLFDPWIDGGYCHFIHTSWDNRICDAVHDPGREREWGGEYGPYVVSRFTTGDPMQSTITYVMSTFNPYNTVLMQSTLRLQPEALPTHVTGAPSLIQGRFGATGNFEVVTPVAGSGLAHLWRENDTAGLPWRGPLLFGTGAGQIDAVALIQSNFGVPGNLELVARTGDALVFFWRDDAGWHGPVAVVADGVPVTGVAGNPTLIQGRFGRRGHFEVVIPLAGGGLAHYWRDNDTLGLPWHGPIPLGTGAGRVDAASLIQSNFGVPGNLEVVARIGDRLVFFWRDGGPSFTWHGPDAIIADGRAVSGVSGNPALIQSRFGRQGNLEVVVPLAAGGVAHLWRDNDSPGLPWHGPVLVEPALAVDAVALIESNFGDPGNLEVVARTGDQLVSTWRDSGPAFAWQGIALIAPG